MPELTDGGPSWDQVAAQLIPQQPTAAEHAGLSAGGNLQPNTRPIRQEPRG